MVGQAAFIQLWRIGSKLETNRGDSDRALDEAMGRKQLQTLPLTMTGNRMTCDTDHKTGH